MLEIVHYLWRDYTRKYLQKMYRLTIFYLRILCLCALYKHCGKLSAKICTSI